MRKTGTKPNKGKQEQIDETEKDQTEVPTPNTITRTPKKSLKDVLLTWP